MRYIHDLTSTLHALLDSMPRALTLVALLALVPLLVACQPSSSGSPATTPAAPSVMLPDSVLTPPDSTADRFDRVMTYAEEHELHDEPVGRIMQELGLRFKGAPYLAGTLDAPSTETLVLRLDGFDCVTFVETTLAMARGVAQRDASYEGFARRMAQQRYRDGTMNGYCSRLHYFTEWVADNEKLGIVEDLSDDLGGHVLPDTLDFMSTHRSAYDRFATNDSLFACVQKMETHLQTENPSIHYIPQDSIRAVYDQLRAGDILAFVTSIDGLDVAHTGLVYKGDGGSTGVLHASLNNGVVVSPDLQRYVQQIDSQIGIVVARPHRVK